MRRHTLAFHVLFVLVLLCVGLVQAQGMTRRQDTPGPNGDIPSTSANAIYDGNLTYVKDSGICETTPGVHQVSGYINVSKDTYLWFWFFEARTNPDTAPLTLWVNGGPGYSLAGNGFSYGAGSDYTIQGSAEQMWVAFQMLFGSQEFSKFKDRRLIFATESFGARLGPAFIRYFNSQNERIDKGEIGGYKVGFTSMLVNNGGHDPLTQMTSLVDFTTNAPGYGRLQNETVVNEMKDALVIPDGCRDSLQRCALADDSPTGSMTCKSAYVFCHRHVLAPAIRGRSATDLTRSSTDPKFPPLANYQRYIRSPEVMAKIGAISNYDQCSDPIKSAFIRSGETARSSLGDLAELANSRLPILIWAGDYDIKSNWIGVHNSMVAMNWYGNQMLNDTPYSIIQVGDEVVAEAKVVDSFSFARVYRAGHLLPSYQPKTAMAIFQGFVQNNSLSNMIDQTPQSSQANNASAKRAKGWFVKSIALGAVTVALL
ncbi:alpha/beta-hydrolase [Macrolepiota fuliginosa MF-IS2]|uniref:Alpha/beta-hydrolase n=1 Tax=Macrolepiota fuliginosa MF-IS2 TaxID=1400762 RepID=A0A9P5X858_9AGAR|nr:alpha/beta-hydrolase [Macrolepiota fuliginosa MF-IS2]